jgi:hypothetical protein
LGSERAGESFPSRAVGFGGFCAVHGWAAWGGLGAFGAMPGAAHSQHHRPPIQHTTPSTVYPVAQLQHQHYSVGLRHSICWSRCRCRCSPATPIARDAPMPAAIHQPGSHHPSPTPLLDMDALWQVSPPASVAHGCPSGRLAESCCRLMPQRYPSAALGRATGPLASHLSPPLSIARLW